MSSQSLDSAGRPSSALRAGSRLRSLLAQGWPTIAELRMSALHDNADVASWASHKRMAGELIGGWDHVAQTFRYPPFQFEANGQIHPRIPELLRALGEHPDRTATADETGWRRLYWLYQPSRALSRQALSRHSGALTPGLSSEETMTILMRLLDNVRPLDEQAQTPAEAFQKHPDAVIALAYHTSRMASSEFDAEGNLRT